MANSWSFVTLGKAVTQGSKRLITVGGQPRMIEASRGHAEWRNDIVRAAPPGPMLEGPVAVSMIFTFARPTTARKKDIYPYKAPDSDKLARLALDSCTVKGLWRDDGQVADLLVRKRWVGDDKALLIPGLLIAATEMVGSWGHLLAVLEMHTLALHREEREEMREPCV